MEMALTADPITAEKGAEYGLVSRVTEKGGAVEGAMELADRIAQRASFGCSIKADDSGGSGSKRSRVLGAPTSGYGCSVLVRGRQGGLKGLCGKAPTIVVGSLRYCAVVIIGG